MEYGPQPITKYESFVVGTLLEEAANTFQGKDVDFAVVLTSHSKQLFDDLMKWLKKDVIQRTISNNIDADIEEIWFNRAELMRYFAVKLKGFDDEEEE